MYYDDEYADILRDNEEDAREMYEAEYGAEGDGTMTPEDYDINDREDLGWY